MSAPKVAIGIKTFNRGERLQKCVSAIIEHCDIPYRLYIADDGEITPAVASLYDQLAADGHVIRRYEQRVNVTTARNELVSLVEDEDFFLRLDDDFMFCPETNLGAMLTVMQRYPHLGAIAGIERQMGDGKGVPSGTISNAQGHMFILDGTLYKACLPVDDWIWSDAGGVRFAMANFTRNFLLIRKAVFETVRWNENLIIQGEHSAFMLDLQRAGWGLAFTPDSIHLHDESGAAPSEEYRRARHRSTGEEAMRAEFRKHYGVKRIRLLHLAELAGTSASPSLRSRVHRAWKGLRRRMSSG